MTRFTLTALLLGFFCFTNLKAKARSSINFQNLSFSEVKIKAAQQQRHILAYIQGDWCIGCQIMEETTFTDQKLGQYINDEFLAVKVDIHSALGKEWDNEFQITCLPTFLIFDKNGQLLDRHESTFTGTALEQILRQSIEPDFIAQTKKSDLASNYDTNAASRLIKANSNDESSAAYSSSVKSSNNDFSSALPDSNEQEIIKQHIEQLELLLQKNEALVEESTDTKQTDMRCQELFSNSQEIRDLIEALKAVQGNQASQISPLKEAVVAASVPYERQIQTEKTTSNNSNSTIKKLYGKGGHKIQLGEYTDYNKASAMAKKLESTFQSKEVFLLIDKKGDYRIYRLLVKGFENQQEASDFIIALKEMGFEL